MASLFISYSRKDIEVARKIVNALAENNLDTWIDWHSIPKGEDWEQEIYRGMKEAEAFLFLISPDSVQSEMCNRGKLHMQNKTTNGSFPLSSVILIQINSFLQFQEMKSKEEIGFFVEINWMASPRQLRTQSKLTIQIMSG